MRRGFIATGNTGLANQQQSTANQQGQSILSGATSVLGALSDESMKYSMKDLSGSGDTGGKSYQPADWGKFVDTMKSKMTPGGSPSGAMQGFDLSGKGAPASATTATGGPNFAGLASDTTAGASPLAGLAGGAGASAGGAGALMALSDKNAKTDTQPKNMKEVLNSLLANVKPVSYKYKPGVEVAKPEGTPRVGIIAQDLEKTPLKDTVMDTPQGKQLDVGQLTANNTALIIELAGQIRDLQQQLKGTK